MMISSSDKSALKKVIQSESRPQIQDRQKMVILMGLATAVIGGLLGYYADIPFSGYMFIAGVSIFFSQLVRLPVPWRYADEDFRRKPLRVKTVEKLSASLSPGALAKLSAMKDSDSVGCLRVSDLFYVLDEDAKAYDEEWSRNLAEKQRAALTKTPEFVGDIITDSGKIK